MEINPSRSLPPKFPHSLNSSISKRSVSLSSHKELKTTGSKSFKKIKR